MELTTVFLDFDDTLIDFGQSERNAFCETWASFHLPLPEGVYERYSAINDACWKRFERGELTKDRVYLSRYEQLFDEFSVPLEAPEYNRRYLENLSHQAPRFDGAEALCRALHDRYKVYITTNGDARGQHRRLALSGLSPFVDGLFVSEEIGSGKPSVAYWEYVFAKIDEHDPARTLVIGDSETSDMRSGLNMGMHTLWLNRKGAEPRAAYDFIARDTIDILRVLQNNGLV